MLAEVRRVGSSGAGRGLGVPREQRRFLNGA